MRSKVFQHCITLDPIEACGSKKFSIKLIVTNLSSETVHIEPFNLDQMIGEIISTSTSTENTELSNLENQKVTLISDIELNIKKIFLHQVIKEEKLDKKKKGRGIIITVLTILSLENIAQNIYKNLFNKYYRKLPEGLESATKINNITDLKIIERVIGEEELKKDSLLIKSFRINRDKLDECIKQILELNNLKTENPIGLRLIDVPPKSDIQFSYMINIPFRFTEQETTFHFNSKVISSKNSLLENLNLEKKIEIQPSLLAIPLGAFIGGIIGYFLKSIFRDYRPKKHILLEILACSVLALILSMFIRKMPKKKKFIPFTIEDFWGGIILGVSIGLFTDNFLDYFEGSFPDKK